MTGPVNFIAFSACQWIDILGLLYHLKAYPTSLGLCFDLNRQWLVHAEQQKDVWVNICALLQCKRKLMQSAMQE